MTPDRSNSERRNGLLCALLSVAALLITYPVAEVGFQDDWSYIRTALEFAKTGHFVYNGWATAMLGWVIPWSALFIKLFGFSFTLVRASLLPFTAACIFLFHASLVRFGIRGRDALLGTLTLGLSPMFVPLATSYMTDVPGMFVIVLCIYLCQRAAAAEQDRAAILWLCCAAATNVIGGTVRQIAWLGALVMVPATAWLLRRRRGIPLTGALLWIASIAGIAGFLRWWSHQPLSVPERILQGPVTITMVHHLFGALAKGFLCLLLLIYPVLVAWLASGFRRGRSAAIRLGLPIVVAAIAIVLIQRWIPDAWLVPWLTHMIQTEMRGSAEFPGVVQISWAAPWRELITLFVVAAAIAFVSQVIRRKPVAVSDRDSSAETSNTGREILWILGPFSFAYLLLLVPRSLYNTPYDRYYLGFMPLGIVLLLRWYRQRVGMEAPAICFVFLSFFAIFAVASTHDWWAVNRAREAALNEVLAAGVPRTEIQGAFELDGWAEIDAVGYINERNIALPKGLFHENVRIYKMPIHCWHFFAWYTPAINPRYLVVSRPMDCFYDSKFPPVRFRIWMPPFHREVFVQEMPPFYR